MKQTLTVSNLFESLRERLRFEWIAGHAGGHRTIELDPGGDPDSSSLIGHLNFIHTHRIQVIGPTELKYLQELDEDFRTEALDMLFSAKSDLVILCGVAEINEELKALADIREIALFVSPIASHEVINHLHYYYSHEYADRVTLHGVYLEVMGIGLLITGDAAIGKSELALELVSRGNRLIADDSPEFARVAPDLISGSCPELLRDFLEVRGLGILNVRAMFGDSAIKDSKYLRLVINLKTFSDEELATMDRLQGSRTIRNILGVEIPEITLPVAPGRNLAVLVEAAARNHILRLKGYDSSITFIKRQRDVIQRNQ